MSASPRSYSHLPSQADLFYLCTTLSTSDTDLNTRLGPPSAPRIRVGVVILGEHGMPLLDLATVDMLAMLTRERAERMRAPIGALEETIALDIHFVSESGEGTVPIMSGARIPITHSFEDSPPFNVLIIPGTLENISDSASAFLRAQSSSPNIISIMCIASGILALANTGILHQKRANAPSHLLRGLRQRYPDTEWQDTKWTRHENIWSSSSSLGAIEMMAAWMREYFWDRYEIVEWTLKTVGVSNNGN